MKIVMGLLVLYSTVALAEVTAAFPRSPANSLSIIEDRDDDVLQPLEKRRGCSGHRLNSDRCEGKKLFPMNSFHNWWVLTVNLDWKTWLTVSCAAKVQMGIAALAQRLARMDWM